MKLKIKKDLNAVTPKYATIGSACFDIFNTHPEPVRLEYSTGFIFPTGLYFEIPIGYVMLVFSRSGHGFKNNVRLANCTGIIDSDYRGELKVKLMNDGLDTFTIYPADRIAQGMLIPVQQVEFEEVTSLTDTVRGAGGFGSTGQ